ncbi:hypothetical protein LTS18_000873, partial [Coniosporium uncinatum]
YGIPVTKSGNTCAFTLDQPHYLIIKIDGRRQLVLLADPWDDQPTTGSGILNVQTEYGADATGSNYATSAIQSAIDDANKAGGGTVYVPPGLYKCGNLVLSSNVHLHLAGGSVLRFAGTTAGADKDQYKTWWYKNGQPYTFWIRTEFYSENISITGRGTLDGNGHSTFPNSANPDGMGVTILAPMLTGKFHYNGPIIREASFWAFNVISVTGATIRNLKVLERMDMGENDGIDVNQSSDVLVQRSLAIAWDDPFSTKTWGRKQTGVFMHIPGNDPTIPGKPNPNRNITFEHAVSWTGCFGMKVGQGTFEDQIGITFRDVVVYDAAVGIGVHHRSGNARASDILFENIDIERLSWENGGKTTWLAVYVEDRNEGVGPIGDVVVRGVK